MFGDPITNSKLLPLIPLGEACNMKAGKGIKANDINDEFREGMYPCYGGNGLRGYVKDFTHEGAIPLIGRQGTRCIVWKYSICRRKILCNRAYRCSSTRIKCKYTNTN